VRTLEGLHYSPWTERALWVLDHHGLDYRYVEHELLFGMPALRWRIKEWRKPLTVPALIEDGGETFGESLEIARHADELGARDKLFGPDLDSAELVRWNEVSDRALDAGRALLWRAISEDKAAQIEALPPWMPRPLRPALRFMARVGLTYFSSEFESILASSPREHEESLAAELAAVREGLRRAGGDYLLGGRFSYADITAAVILQMVSPLAGDRYIRLEPATRRAWTRDKLAAEYGDLVAWRDKLYARHRGERRVYS
jgi:glutathione S-transferase